jgi:hypothetical protein
MYETVKAIPELDGLNRNIIDRMSPFDFEVSLYTPLTEKISITPSVYYYNASYTEENPIVYNFQYTERFWYVGLSLEYTFSTKPLFE